MPQLSKRSSHPFPHRYLAAATGGPVGLMPVTSPGLPELLTAAPPQFDGPAGVWSPEALLTATIANCYILTFRAVTRAALFGWIALECQVESVLEPVEGVLRFSHVTITPTLTLTPGADAARARRLLRKAERVCVVSNSLRAERNFHPRIITQGSPSSPSARAL
jgi:organic hydroperoxide reductase OsmC/OhrA